ncbi:hypothetical protein A5662_07610 [Mycobacteriaceae bacterium 1482268.1]|nr:hypothetical protein A5662_07610 [Mycobacteriaceae bacterium 1482268.1]
MVLAQHRRLTPELTEEAALRYQAALVNHVSDAIIGITATGNITSWNPAAESIYGRSFDEARGHPVSELVGAAVDPAAIVASGGIAHTTHRSADGAPLKVRLSAAVMPDGYVLVCCDLTTQYRAEQHFQTVVDSMAEGVIVLDKDGRIKSINPAAVQIMGVGVEYVGSDFFTITDQLPFYDADGVNIPTDRRPARAALRDGVSSINQIYGFDRMSTERVWLMSSCRLLNPDLPGRSDLLISFVDVTAERADADKILFYATHDALTRLPNRVSVLRRLRKALASGDGGEPLRWVLFIDLDNLKLVNDTMGHTAGDQLLCAAAESLRSVADSDEVVGRLGGDEFVVLVCHDLSRSELDDKIARMRAELATPVGVGGTHVSINASIGVVEVHRDEQRTADEILRDADLAMYEAKRARRAVNRNG